MKKDDFLDKWRNEKPMYDAWGKFVTSFILEQLKKNDLDLDSFLKQPAVPRVKLDDSLIDKAFYRPDKNYANPYEDIEDKVGVRFVVLLLEHIKVICTIIESCEVWNSIKCRHFESEREDNPLLFTYQSVHFIVRAKKELSFNGIKIKQNTPCEIQVRTLLQHAYAELTHDAIYKAKKRIVPAVHRTVAKSMALIETTDEFFESVQNNLNQGNIEDYKIEYSLDTLYLKLVGSPALPMQKSSFVVLYEFEDLLKSDFVEKLEIFFTRNMEIVALLQERSQLEPFYRQSVSLLAVWLIKLKRSRVMSDWPLEFGIIENLAADLGVSLDDS